MKRGIALVVTLAAVAAGFAAPSAQAQTVDCRVTTVGDYLDVRYCLANTSSVGTVTVDPNITATCSITKPVNLNVACTAVALADAGVSNVGRTGFVPNLGFPLPSFSGTNVSHPGGSAGTLWLNGSGASIYVPPFCSGTAPYCGTSAVAAVIAAIS